MTLHLSACLMAVAGLLLRDMLTVLGKAVSVIYSCINPFFSSHVMIMVPYLCAEYTGINTATLLTQHPN